MRGAICGYALQETKINAVQSRATSAQTAKPLGKDSTEKLSPTLPPTKPKPPETSPVGTPKQQFFQG